MKKIYKFGTEKTYFSCLDVYESSIPYDLDKNKEESVHSSFVRKLGDTVLNRYKIIKVFQENTFGFVYLVERVNKNKKYIIKEFFPHEYVTRNDKGDMILNTPLDIDSLIRFNYMQRFFMGEANNLEKISIKPHSNILKVSSVEKNKNNTTYIIYPYEEGMTLQRYMEIKSRMGKAQLDRNELDKILNPLVEAVEHLHALNIYHLNIKPENILIKKDGSLLLSGFESSSFFNDEDSRVFCNAYTPLYAAPEQLDRNSLFEIGRGSDIYAIGFLLHRLITGHCPPSAEERMSCKNKEVSYDPYSFLQEKTNLLENYDRHLLFAIDKSLMYRTDERFRSISSFKAALFGTPETFSKKNMKKGNKKIIFYFLALLAIVYILFKLVSSMESDKKIEVLTHTKDIVKNYESKLNTQNNKKIDEDNTIKIEDNFTEISESTTIKEEFENNISQNLDSVNTYSLEESHEKEVSLEENERKKETVIKTETNIQKMMNNKVKDVRIHETSNVENKIEIDSIDDELNIDSVPKIAIDKNETIFIDLPIKIDNAIKKIKFNSVIEKNKNIVKRKKSVIKTLKKRKKHIIRKKKTKKNIQIQRKKAPVKNSSGLVWYCKAIGGNVRSSVKNADKSRAKSIALSQCRRKAGSRNNCRILNCFLVR